MPVAVQSMLFKVWELEPLKNVKFGIYGPPGSGKTYALSTLPDKARPVFIADFDNGLRSLKNAGKCDDIYFQYYDSWDRFMSMFHKLCSSGTVKLGAETITPKTFVIDSWTNLEERKRTEMFKGVEHSHKLAKWGEFLEKDKGFLLQLQTLKMNVVVLFHNNAIYEEATKVMWEQAITYGAASGMPSRLPGFFDEFYYSVAKIPPVGATKKREYNWITAASRTLTVRTRSGLPTSIPQDFSKIFNRKENEDVQNSKSGNSNNKRSD